MKRIEQDFFARPFAEIWQHSPFQPQSKVAGFLDKFQKAGRFDADRFWEYVAVSTRASLTRRQPGKIEQRPAQYWTGRLG